MLDPVYFGSLGAFLILLAFILAQFHIWKDTYFVYDLTNLLGSGFLIYYAWTGSSWPFLVLNSVWALVSFRDCVIDLKRNARKVQTIELWDRWMT